MKTFPCGGARPTPALAYRYTHGNTNDHVGESKINAGTPSQHESRRRDTRWQAAWSRRRQLSVDVTDPLGRGHLPRCAGSDAGMS